MNLDELITTISDLSSEAGVQRLVTLLQDWKSNKSTVEELHIQVERYIGNIWIESERTHAEVYRLWSSFRQSAISTIGGMTINERLYWFGLTSRFDRASSKEAQQEIYAKLHAVP